MISLGYCRQLLTISFLLIAVFSTPLIACNGTADRLTAELRAQRELFLLRQEENFVNGVFDKFKDHSSEMLLLQNLALAFKDLDLVFKDAEIETIFKTMDMNCDGCKRVVLCFKFT
jgi:hypothetical protein